MATTTTTTNKPLNPRAQDLSPKGYNRANIFSGKALSFDGVNDILTTGAVSAAFNSLSISGYMKFDALGIDRIALSLASVNSNNERFIIFNNASDGEKLHIYAPLINVSASYSSNYTIKAGQWFHYAITFGTSMTFYINGRQTATHAVTNSTALSNDFIFGARKLASYSQYFNGDHAGFKAFGVTLTPAQVSDLYLNPEKIVPDGVASSALKLWLPMMEGAGASAYDGSGNGNDGTINGATWTAGIGAPVAQTALVSWDKGVNLATHSEDFANGAWTKISTSVAFNTATAPNGTMTADSLNSTSSTEAIFQLAQANTIDFSVYAKAGTTTSLQLASSVSFNGRAADFNLSTGTAGAVYQLGTGDPSISGGTSSIESVGNGWYKCSINSLVLSAARAVTIANNNGNLSYIWGASLRPTSAGDAYIKTNATAQTSAVLVPEGLTAGASIFGTDIITPRNAFALNLDGASWSKVRANASFLFGTGAFTLEAWVKLRYINSGSYANEIISVNDSDDFAVKTETTGTISFLSSTSRIAHSVSLNGDWGHVVALRESGGTTRLYFNGTQVASGTDSQNIPMTEGVRIGTDNTENSRTYKDQLANPRIYNRALTAAEVLRNYNADRPKFGL